MDQEPQPSVWPPAPKGMEQTPFTNATTFKAAPTQWVVGLTLLSAAQFLIQSLCDLGLTLSPKNAVLVAVNSALQQPWNVIYVIAGIAFFIWFYRVYKNLSAFETLGLRYTAGWAVGWFFVPIFSLFRPYQIAQTIWKASSPTVDGRDVSAWQRAPSGGIVIAWWAISILSNCLAFVPLASGYGRKSAGPDLYIESAIENMSSVAAALVTVFLIRAISTRQQEKEIQRFWSEEE